MFQTKRKLKKEISNSEERAINHFKKLFKIEQILKESDQSKELYAITVEKIKKVIQ